MVRESQRPFVQPLLYEAYVGRPGPFNSLGSLSMMFGLALLVTGFYLEFKTGDAPYGVGAAGVLSLIFGYFLRKEE